MIIYCSTPEEFMDCIRDLVMRGLTFEAHARKLQIELTGGY